MLSLILSDIRVYDVINSIMPVRSAIPFQMLAGRIWSKVSQSSTSLVWVTLFNFLKVILSQIKFQALLILLLFTVNQILLIFIIHEFVALALSIPLLIDKVNEVLKLKIALDYSVLILLLVFCWMCFFILEKLITRCVKKIHTFLVISFLEQKFLYPRGGPDLVRRVKSTGGIDFLWPIINAINLLNLIFQSIVIFMVLFVISPSATTLLVIVLAITHIFIFTKSLERRSKILSMRSNAIKKWRINANKLNDLRNDQRLVSQNLDSVFGISYRAVRGVFWFSSYSRMSIMIAILCYMWFVSRTDYATEVWGPGRAWLLVALFLSFNLVKVMTLQSNLVRSFDLIKFILRVVLPRLGNYDRIINLLLPSYRLEDNFGVIELRVVSALTEYEYTKICKENLLYMPKVKIQKIDSGGSN